MKAIIIYNLTTHSYPLNISVTVPHRSYRINCQLLEWKLNVFTEWWQNMQLCCKEAAWYLHLLLPGTSSALPPPPPGRPPHQHTLACCKNTTCFILVLLFESRYYWTWTQFDSIQSFWCHHYGFRLLFLHPWNGLGFLLRAASCCCLVLLGPYRLNTRSFEEGLHDSSCWCTRWKESTQQLTSLQIN